MSPEKSPAGLRVDALLMSDEFLPYTLQHAVGDLIALAATLPDGHDDLNRRLQANLLRVTREATAPEARQFLTDSDAVMEDALAVMESDGVDIESRDMHVPLMSSLDSYLKSFLGDRYIDASDEAPYRTIAYQRDGETMLMEVVSENNFYFKPPEEIFAPEDSFPPDGNIAPTRGARALRQLIGKNVSAFNPNGGKVFWGDLRHADIKKLKGTYYILSQRSSYLDVPSFAVVTESDSLADDPNRPAGALTHLMPLDKPGLDPDYVRAHCMGAIVRGKYVAHEQSAEA